MILDPAAVSRVRSTRAARFDLRVMLPSCDAAVPSLKRRYGLEVPGVSVLVVFASLRSDPPSVALETAPLA